MNMNVDFIRRQFPALSGDWIYFDNAGGTQTLQHVADRIQEYLLTTNVQLGATYDISKISTNRVDMAIQTVADFINANHKKEVILGSSTSLLLKILSMTLAETFKPGDEIIVTNCDHEANIGPWRSLEKNGIKIKEWRLHPETLELHIEDLESLLTKKTRLVALTHISNILGTIHPIKKITSIIHDHGAMICVDGVAYAPHRQVDVQELDVDFYVFSFYKVYGPHYSVLYGKEKHLEKMPGINHYFLEKEIPMKFQPGNVNYELTYGLTGITDYFSELACLYYEGESPKNKKKAWGKVFEYIAQHEELLSKKLLDFLITKSNVQIIGKKESDSKIRVPTISFVIDKVKSSTITQAVDKHLIGIRYGDFYAKRLINDLNLAPRDGVVRVSMVHYNTLEEVDRLIQVFDTLF